MPLILLFFTLSLYAGTTRLLDLARHYGCANFVYASSSSVYGSSTRSALYSLFVIILRRAFEGDIECYECTACYLIMTQLHTLLFLVISLFISYFQNSELLSEDDVVEKPVSPYAATKKSW
jgi:nucleoside-diphosphate-sugar epimerase